MCDICFFVFVFLSSTYDSHVDSPLSSPSNPAIMESPKCIINFALLLSVCVCLCAFLASLASCTPILLQTDHDKV